MTYRTILKLRDGRVYAGFTPAFDPIDRSVWLSPTPDSPAGTMYALDRVRVLVLEPLGARTMSLPANPDHTPVLLRLQFEDGEILVGQARHEVPGYGMWVEPAGRPRARAFLPRGAVARIDAVIDRSQALSWAFIDGPVTDDSSPTDSHALPTIAPAPLDAKTTPSEAPMGLPTEAPEPRTVPPLASPEAPPYASWPADEETKTTPDDETSDVITRR